MNRFGRAKSIHANMRSATMPSQFAPSLPIIALDCTGWTNVSAAAAEHAASALEGGAVLFLPGLAFDVALHVSFVDKAAHDAYQEHPRHQRFLGESRPNWKQVRVFDSWVDLPAARA